MPRKPYIWFPNAKYHIFNRGSRKSTLFFDDEDRGKWLTIIKEVKEKYPFNLYAYCLMTNHIHLLVETSQDPPDKFMKMINQNYSIYFNKKYKNYGHVFQGRYQRKLVDSILYELDVSKYIHLNPLDAKLVTKLEDYPWSSYRAYIHQEDNPLIIKDHILSYFLHPQPQNYEKYVHSPNTDLSVVDFNHIYQQKRDSAQR